MQQLLHHTLATMLAALTMGYSESALGQTVNLQQRQIGKWQFNTYMLLAQGLGLT